MNLTILTKRINCTTKGLRPKQQKTEQLEKTPYEYPRYTHGTKPETPKKKPCPQWNN